MSAQEELETLIQDVAERIAQCNAEDLPEQALALAWIRDRISAIREGLGKAQEPVGRVLAEEEMGIGYDRRMGDVIWFSGRKKPGFLYQSLPADHAQVLVDALEFYANREHYETPYGRMYSDVQEDYGETATQALAAHKSEVKG